MLFQGGTQLAPDQGPVSSDLGGPRGLASSVMEAVQGQGLSAACARLCRVCRGWGPPLPSPILRLMQLVQMLKTQQLLHRPSCGWQLK